MYSKLRRSLVALMLVGAFLLSVGTALAEKVEDVEKVGNTAIIPTPKKGSWLKRHEAMNKRVAQGNVDLLFIGDSITQGWASKGKGKEVWEEYYADRNAVNLGISGDRTQHVLWRLANGNIKNLSENHWESSCGQRHFERKSGFRTGSKNISPKLAVVMIGLNNHPPRNTPEETAEGITKIVEKLRADLPKTKILLLAIFPNGKTPAFPTRLACQKVNKMIQKLGDDENVIYLDLYEKFVHEDGTITKDVMRDYTHPTQKGYCIWAEAIEPYVEKYVGKKKK